MTFLAVAKGRLSRLFEKVGGECDGETGVYFKRAQEHAPQPGNALGDKDHW